MLKRILTTDAAIVAGVTLLAAFLRVWQLDSHPARPAL